LHVKHHSSTPGDRSRSRGAYLLEALIALIVFSFAMLGLLALLAGAIDASGRAKWRSEGFAIAAGAVARIATEDPASLVERYDASRDGAGYKLLLAQASGLPGVSDAANAPSVGVDDAVDSRRVRVTVRWQLPGEASAHEASISAALPHR
jgi:type IV pilus assembly protein PilV